jgi:deoxyribonuclease-4
MKVGAHVSASGGPDKAIDRALEIGAEAIQMFVSSPRAWRFSAPKEDSVISFREKVENTGLGPTFFHGSYLVNMGGTADLAEKSVESLVSHMNAAGQRGALGVIFHLGSHRGVGLEDVYDQVILGLKKVIKRTPQETWLVIENSAGMGSHIGASFSEIGRIISSMDSDRVKVCLDTQHSFAAGYNLADRELINSSMSEFDREIGFSQLVAVHANDSKMELGSGVDRHANIGEGYIGISGFEIIMGHSAFHDVPFLLEVPGSEKSGPDKENVDRVKQIRDRLGLSR